MKVMGLPHWDLLELEVLVFSLGDMGHNILLGYKRGESWPSGPENSGSFFVAYIGGEPIEIWEPFPMVTIDDISKDMKTVGEILEVWADNVIRSSMTIYMVA